MYGHSDNWDQQDALSILKLMNATASRKKDEAGYLIRREPAPLSDRSRLLLRLPVLWLSFLQELLLFGFHEKMLPTAVTKSPR